MDPPCTKAKLVYADACAVTGSLYATARALSAVMLEDTTRGAMPSTTGRCETDPSALADASVNATVPGA